MEPSYVREAPDRIAVTETGQDQDTDEFRFNTIPEALLDLRQGKLVVVADDEDRENEGDFIGAAEKATPEMINFMATHGRGLICVAITGERATELNLSMMVELENNTALHQTAFTVSVDYSLGTTTGISAADRAKTVVALADPHMPHTHFVRPGHIFPLRAAPGGIFRRMGHTEAGVDLARLAGLQSAAVLVEIMNDDGTMARVPNLIQIAKQFHLKIITIKDLLAYRLRHESRVERVVSVDLPTRWGEFELVAFRDVLTGDGHLALTKGSWTSSESVLVRVHSECMTGDAFGSLRCDCGDQIQLAMQMIERAGKGAVLYLRQEGRGIGLFNKLKAYRLQEAGFDTVQANVALGFNPDDRDYNIASHMLYALDLRRIKLLTNNPAKLDCLRRAGIEIEEHIPMPMQVHGKNRRYMRTKHDKLGHFGDLLLSDRIVPNWD